MTLREALKKGVELLKDAGIEAPAADAGVMLCHAEGCGRAFLYAHGEKPMERGRLADYLRMLDKRVSGIPVQYITGRCEFMSLEFKVEPGVLIPRQDTEILVEYVIDHCRRLGRTATILDIGTGSGCIAVSLAHHVRECLVTAVDISRIALDIAKNNALNQKVSDRVEFLVSNLFSGLGGRSFDIIVSNPPYIRSSDIPGLQREVRSCEPLGALDGGKDGLSFYRAIVDKACGFLKDSGLLAFEVGMGQAGQVAALLEGRFRSLDIVKDLSGIDRVVAGRLGWLSCIQSSGWQG